MAKPLPSKQTTGVRFSSTVLEFHMTVQIRRGSEAEHEFDHELGSYLRKLRLSRNMKLTEVHDLTNIRYDHLSRIERGESRLSVIELMKLSIVYNIDAQTILDDLWPLIEMPAWLSYDR
jgi:hypothetical protein